VVGPAAPGKAVLVTGASSGIGRAIAERLAREGWRVYAGARHAEALADLERLGCEVLHLDVNHERDRTDAFARLDDECGGLDALVNNAGYGQQGPLEETPLDAIRAQLETNVVSVAAMCQLALPRMRSRGAGRIVNVSSMGGRLTFPGGASYHASKFALEAMSDVLRFEVAGFGVRVIVIEPGPTASAFGEAALASLDRLSPSDDGAYEAFKDGIRAALRSTFDDASAAGDPPEHVAEAVLRALEDPEPAPRVIVGAAAEHLIATAERGTEADWDTLVGSMYPQPGFPRAED